MKKVRRLKCKKDMNDMLVVDGIYVEYALTPHHFYPPGRTDLVEQVGIDVRMFEKRNMLNEHFDELDSIEWKETREYPQVLHIIQNRIDCLEKDQKELEYLKNLV